ncbi:MAG: hypothetical protein IT353_21950 [Gemmatimonadaceae bacterium]|nr:hypothetical protein [Gemmatimonadaceae bacterium]
MNDEFDNSTPEPRIDVPLDPWMIERVQCAMEVPTEAIPREMMWARLQRQRAAVRDGEAEEAAPLVSPVVVRPLLSTPTTSPIAPSAAPTRWLRVAGMAAMLVGAVGVGRYLLPATGPSKYALAIQDSARRADSVAALGLGPDALAALPPSSDPARVAMDEHLARTVALLVSVRDSDVSATRTTDVGAGARELLGTTRLLLDEPQLRDERTRRLLQDLELVLAQIVQVRQTAPETRRAPNETMRETNLLPRMRAAVSASRPGEETTFLGGM